ncbi:SgcJ/EcaC family oxidoreductase [Saccharomonospora sp. NPDC006951]
METKNAQSPVVRGQGTDADIAALKKVIEDTETAYNTNDAELMTKHFATEASVVNAVGKRIVGRDALLASNQQGLTGFLKDQYVRYDIAEIHFVRPDVALVHKQARATTSSGELIDKDPAMLALYVLEKQDGQWWIVVRQNTLVPS